MRRDTPDQHAATVERDRDDGLRRMLTWVAGAFILTVLFAILVVELTLRWLGNP